MFCNFFNLEILWKHRIFWILMPLLVIMVKTNVMKLGVISESIDIRLIQNLKLDKISDLNGNSLYGGALLNQFIFFYNSPLWNCKQYYRNQNHLKLRRNSFWLHNPKVEQMLYISDLLLLPFSNAKFCRNLQIIKVLNFHAHPPQIRILRI